MIEFWNTRYDEPQYAYGKSPNAFLREVMATFSPKGSILFPAEGEGRNAVYAATQGLQVSAFDISNSGRNKAIQLANKHNVTLDYQVGELPYLHYKEDSFDHIALIYAHFPSSVRTHYHKLLSKLLKKGGYLFFEAFSKNHIPYRTKNPKVGGPDNLSMLFSVEDIQNEFKDIEIITLEETIVTLQEGNYHNGEGSVIRYIGRKR